MTRIYNRVLRVSDLLCVPTYFYLVTMLVSELDLHIFHIIVHLAVILDLFLYIELDDTNKFFHSLMNGKDPTKYCIVIGCQNRYLDISGSMISESRSNYHSPSSWLHQSHLHVHINLISKWSHDFFHYLTYSNSMQISCKYNSITHAWSERGGAFFQNFSFIQCTCTSVYTLTRFQADNHVLCM